MAMNYLNGNERDKKDKNEAYMLYFSDSVASPPASRRNGHHQ